MLRLLAVLINQHPSKEIGITLNVHGSLVSGMMISRSRYYEETGKQMIEAIQDPTGADVSKFRKELQEMFTEFGSMAFS